MGSQITQAEISVRWAGNARPLALPMGELARLKAVTERAGSTRWQFESVTLVVVEHRWGSPGSMAGDGRDWAGSARPLALPMGELARLKAVTERAGSTRWQFESVTLVVVEHRWGHPVRWREMVATGRAAPAPWLSLWESWHG